MDLETVKAAHLGALKLRLKERRRALQRRIAAVLETSEREDYVTLAGQVHDLGDESLADMLLDVNNADIGRLVDEARDVEAALARLAARTYGTCADCGEIIAAARLDAHPTAKRCRACQEKHERASGTPALARL